MVLPARRFTELNTWRGPTRSSSSTGGTTTTTTSRLEEYGCWPDLYALAIRLGTMTRVPIDAQGATGRDGGIRRICVVNRLSCFATIALPLLLIASMN